MGVTHAVRTMFQAEKPRLRTVQKKALQAARKHKNLLLVAPCGAGKTEAAYLVSKQWSGRTIYALPMKSLATSIHHRLNGYEQHFGKGETWSLQHSGEAGDPHLANRLSVTTVDQVLSGYFGFGRESFIRGSNVVQSNLILDEVQLCEPDKSLSSLFYLLRTLTDFGKNFVLMTATFPTVLQQFLADEFDCGTVVIKESEVPKRTLLDWADALTGADLEQNPHKQIVVCNTQKQQVALYEQITDKDRVIVLNSKLYPSERAQREAEVARYFGKDSEPNDKILLSTQIIEAGMDISADHLYSYEAPIDNLIQREGRCARWGGTGTFTVIQEEKHVVYDHALVEKTTQLIKGHLGQPFDWNTQLAWVSLVLNDHYKKVVSERARKQFGRNMKNASSNDLIRDIRQISVIVTDKPAVSDFNREAISVHIDQIKEGIRSEKGQLQAGKPDIGETVLINGSGWVYDACGLRKEESAHAEPSPLKAGEKQEEDYADYIEETWLEHAVMTKKAMRRLLVRDNLVPAASIARWSTLAGIHDLGKLTTDWQTYIGWTGTTTYAHRPWRPRNNRIIQDKKHNMISALAVKDFCSRLEQNVLMAHHGRLHVADNRLIIVRQTNFVSNVQEQLHTVGFDQEITLCQHSHAFSGMDIIAPSDPEYGLFVYMTGLLMLADRKAISGNRMAFCL